MKIDPGLVEREWVRQAIDKMDSLVADGKVTLAKNYAKRLIDPLPFEPIGEPSGFLMLQWLHTRRRYGLS